MPRFRFRSTIPVPLRFLFDWHEQDGTFERLAPPWQDINVVHRSGSIKDGEILVMEVNFGRLAIPWVALHSNYEYGKGFTDTQISGPFATWVHHHRMHDDGADRSILDDEVYVEPPLRSLVMAVADGLVNREVRRMYRYRHLRTRLDVWRHFQYRGRERMKVAVLGKHPFSTQLSLFLMGGGHEITPLDQATHVVDLRLLDGNGPHVHLATPARRHVQVWPHRFIDDRRSAGTLAIRLPQVVAGLSFQNAAIQRIVSRTPRDGEWIAEDDLIGLVYHTLLSPPERDLIEAIPGDPSVPNGFTFSLLQHEHARSVMTGWV